MARAAAVDVSDRALSLSARNARRHDVLDRLDLIESDLFANVDGSFDLILSNPPYIPEGDALGLQPEVRNFDPPEALFAGKDGLDIIRKIVASSPRSLKPEGFLILEIGQGQAADVKDLFGPPVWSSFELVADLQSIPRTVIARLARQ